MNLPFLLLLILPWLNFINSLVFRKNTEVTSIFLNGILLVFGIYFSFQSAGQSFEESTNWFSIGSININLSFSVSTLSRAMGVLVPLVGFLVQIYSYSYLKEDPKRPNFYIYLNAFIASMILLSLSDNLISFYGAWEMVGLFSYLLIGFWKEKHAANRAATKAFLINRVADFCLLIGLILSIKHFGTFEFSKMNPTLFGTLPNSTALLLILGAAGKSAQFPFSTWLPDAMEGPTPASALIHAATMVTAGVVLGIKIIPLIGLEMQMVFGIIGLISFVLGASLALFQNDLKKVLAYSTISQIGFMWLGLGGSISLFHLLTHGIFKAGLFLVAGIIIHQNESRKIKDPKNIFTMPSLLRRNPILLWTFSIFGLSLMGIPGFSGFYSKENILANLENFSINSPFKIEYQIIKIITYFGLTLSVAYMSRLIYFIGFKNMDQTNEDHEKVNKLEYFPIIVLSLFSLFWIFSFNPFSLNYNFLNTWFGIENILTKAPLLFIVGIIWILGGVLAYSLRNWEPTPIRLGGEKIWRSLFQLILFSSKKFNEIIEKMLDYLIDLLGRFPVVLAHLIHWIDNHIIDFLIVRFNGFIQLKSGTYFARWQRGNFRSYILSAFVSIILLILIISLKKI